MLLTGDILSGQPAELLTYLVGPLLASFLAAFLARYISPELTPDKDVEAEEVTEKYN